MDETQKMFVCGIGGCEMSFTNNAELNWHHKKHDMFLNLGLISKNPEIGDQTPTPTRFIRNCEEVGLFQDLQNVNPFDETFKKAIEGTKMGSLHVPKPSTDDTLHTPHIFPPVEEDLRNFSTSQNESNDNHPNEFCIATISSIQDNPPSNEICATDEYDLIIDLEANEIPQNENNMCREQSMQDLKSRLKEAIMNKEKNEVRLLPRPQIQSPKPDISTKTSQLSSDNREKVRETNRNAQLRCRKRKKIQMESMEKDLKKFQAETTRLLAENRRLHYENQNFKHKLISLHELVSREKCTGSSTLLAEIETILNAPLRNFTVPAGSKEQPKVAPRKLLVRRSESVLTPAVQQQAFQNPSQPVVIKIVGSVTQLSMTKLPQ